MDMTSTITPKSDQINAEDLIAGPATYTIEKVVAGSSEQPVNVHLVELPGRPWRPSKSMRRVLVHVWGKDSAAYVGQRVTLYRDPEVKFGGDPVGGIKVSHMTGITKPVTIALTVTRGKRAPHSVQPLTVRKPAVTEAEVAACNDVAELKDMWKRADTEMRAVIEARVAELNAAPEVVDSETGEVLS